MKTITETELEEILRLHSLWLDGASGGVRADLSGTSLTGADLSGADLSGADLTEANLTRANLSGTSLTGADLSKARLFRADLSKARLFRADLSKANLSGTNLSGANLTEANLTRANLSGTSLTGVCLFNCTGDGKRIRTTRTEIYTINHYDDRCQIGCKNHTLEEWAAFMDDEISAMDDGALEWWKEWREFVLTEKKGEE